MCKYSGNCESLQVAHCGKVSKPQERWHCYGMKGIHDTPPCDQTTDFKHRDGLLSFRKRHDLTSATMAGLLGIGNIGNYSRIENGKRGVTKQQLQALHVLKFIARAGLLSGLIRSIK